MRLSVITAAVALAAFTLPGSEAGAYFKNGKTYIPDGLQLPSCPEAAVNPVEFGTSRPESSCQMLMWLNNAGTFCEHV